MKLEKTYQAKNKLIKLKLIETKFFGKNFKTSSKLVDIIFRLKKCLHLIYNYHVNNKQILFIGLPIEYIKQFKQIGIKNHIYLPDSIWLNGIITNKRACFMYLHKNKKLIDKNFSKLLYQLDNQIDLIVVLDSQFKKNIINESYIANIPLICFDSLLEVSNFKVEYKIFGDFKFSKKKIRSDVFSLILLSTVKKANNNLKKKIKATLLLKNKNYFKKNVIKKKK